MLIAQSFFIRQSRRGLHRAVGKFSYVLVPWIAISTMMLANHQLNNRGVTGEGVYVLMLQLSILVQFLGFYSLAIVNRKRPDVHARYMVCTALPLLDPIFARVLMFNFLTPEQIPLAHFYTYPLTALVLVALVVWDWRSSNRRDVFFPMLFVLVALQLPTFLVTGTAAWQSFAAWFMRLPLS